MQARKRRMWSVVGSVGLWVGCGEPEADPTGEGTTEDAVSSSSEDADTTAGGSGSTTADEPASTGSGSGASDGSSGEPPLAPIDRIPLLGDAVTPEGIGVDAQTGDLYVGSATTGSIQRIPAGGEAEWWKTPEDGDGLRTSTVGVAVDGEGRRLAACNNIIDFETFELIETAVIVYDLDTKERLADVILPAIAPAHLCNDLTAGGDGSFYASDSAANMVWRIDALYEVSAVVDPGTFVTSDSFLGTNGVATSPDGRYVLITQTVDPRLYRLDVETDEVVEVQLDGVVYPGGDGITFIDADTLVSVQNFDHDLVEVTFIDAEYTAGTVSPAVDDPAINEALSRPTTAEIHGGRLYVVNGQFDVDPPVLPFWVTSIPIERLALD